MVFSWRFLAWPVSYLYRALSAEPRLCRIYITLTSTGWPVRLLWQPAGLPWARCPLVRLLSVMEKSWAPASMCQLPAATPLLTQRSAHYAMLQLGKGIIVLLGQRFMSPWNPALCALAP